MIFPKICQSKNKILIAGIIILALVFILFISKNLWFPKVSCVLPNYELAGTPVNKSYPKEYLTLGDLEQYQDPEVKFFLSKEAQDFFSQKISSLRGYGGLSYSRIDKSIRIDKAYKGENCEPLRYYYEMMVRGTLLGDQLSAFSFGRWYYKDSYEIEAIYRPDTKKWEYFNANLKERRLIPGDVLTSVLEIAKKSDQYQKILKEEYKISEIYWTPKSESKNSKNDTVTLVYSKPVDEQTNLKDYYIIEIDNFNKLIVSEKTERK
jgi:hypothetical protein